MSGPIQTWQPLPISIRGIIRGWECFQLRVTTYHDHVEVDIIEHTGPGETPLIHSQLSQAIPKPPAVKCCPAADDGHNGWCTLNHPGSDRWTGGDRKDEDVQHSPASDVTDTCEGGC